MTNKQQSLLPAGITRCARCAVPCRKRSGNAEARLLRHTVDDFGFCANCATTQFLQGLDVITYCRPGAKPFDPGCFHLSHIQTQFAEILAVGHADAKPDEIDWLEVIANWHLPFPKKPKGTM